MPWVKNLYNVPEGFWTPRNRRSIYLSALLLILAIAIQVNNGRYSARRAASANSAEDILLDILPVLDLSYVIVQGALIAFLVSSAIFILRPRYAIFGMKAVALFMIIRSFFINLTQFGIYQGNLFAVAGLGANIYNTINFDGNFFFSGHTGAPFLFALILWQHKFWRWFWVGISGLFGASVLLAHVHYSIDVFAAPFITYGIYRIAARFFPRDYELTTLSGQ